MNRDSRQYDYTGQPRVERKADTIPDSIVNAISGAKIHKLEKEIETLRETVDQLTRTLAACCNARDLTADERDEWKRRAYTIWNRMPSFVEIPKEQQQWFEEE